MTNSIKSLAEIFNNRQFRIPDFQRGYSWQEPQIADFWQDLENLEAGRIHYTGLLTIDRVDKDKNTALWENTRAQNPRLLDNSGFKLFSVIDGQQRLTTSIILISVLLNSFPKAAHLLDEEIGFWTTKFLYKTYPKSEPCYIFGYDHDPSSFEFVKTSIFGQKSRSSDGVNLKTIYTRNLEFAHNFFIKKIESITDEEKSLIFKKLIQQFKYNEFEVGSDLDIHVTFETMNNRGKPLSNLELLKNRLIYISAKLEESTQDKEDLRAEIHNCWRTIYSSLGANDKKMLDDDEFLSIHRNIYFPIDRSNKVFAKEFLLGKTFTVSRIYSGEITIHNIRDYIISLREASKYWYQINFPEESNLPKKTIDWLLKVNRLGFRNLGPASLAAVFMFFDGKCNADDLSEFIKVVERYNFLVFQLSQSRSNAGRSDCLDYAYKIYSTNNAATVSSVSKELKEVVYNTNWGWLDLGKFEEHLKDLFKKRKGFYGWKGLNYFLFEYESHLRTTDDIKVKWEDIKGNSEKSIEHIYPQTPEHNCWKEQFSIIKKKHRENLSHDLGNLVLISKSKNSQIKNYCFDYKKRHSFKGIDRGFFKGSHSEIEVNGYEIWTPKEIHERGLKMLKFLMENWEIDTQHLEYVTGKKLENLLYATKIVRNN